MLTMVTLDVLQHFIVVIQFHEDGCCPSIRWYDAVLTAHLSGGRNAEYADIVWCNRNLVI